MFDEIVVTMDNDGDLITRAEAVKAALDWNVRPHEDVFDAIKSAIAVRMHAVPKAEGWVSVKDRLPEEKGGYLVYAPDYKSGSLRGQLNHKGIMFSYWNGTAWGIEIRDGYQYRKSFVRYWMPIPIPIFFGVEGSKPRFANAEKIHMITGVRNTTMNGLIDWKISALISRLPI